MHWFPFSSSSDDDDDLKRAIRKIGEVEPETDTNDFEMSMEMELCGAVKDLEQSRSQTSSVVDFHEGSSKVRTTSSGIGAIFVLQGFFDLSTDKYFKLPTLNSN